MSTAACPQDFIDWGRRWGTNETEAQVIMQNQWDNILHHLMGITAAMEVWRVEDPSSSSSSAHVEGAAEGGAMVAHTPEGGENSTFADSWRLAQELRLLTTTPTEHG